MKYKDIIDDPGTSEVFYLDLIIEEENTPDEYIQVLKNKDNFFLIITEEIACWSPTIIDVIGVLANRFLMIKRAKHNLHCRLMEAVKFMNDDFK